MNGVSTILHVVAVITPEDMNTLLSRREREVMHYASQGMTNARISVQLGVSTHVVKFHLASIYRKLGVTNRTEATARYITALADLDHGGELK